jgi:phospholipase C
VSSQGTGPFPIRSAGSLPFPDKPRGTVNTDMPFDHIVVVMMENHSFDNLLGDLSRSEPHVDGLTFGSGGAPTNSNPGTAATGPVVTSFPVSNTAQAKHVTQSWKSTHEQIDGGLMDGFVRTSNATEPMGYYTPEVLPFAYSLAGNFTVANRWFSSLPGPTYPNRRFLIAGTAWGCTVTDLKTLADDPPPHGTIYDQLSENHISWCDYFTDIPTTALVPSAVLKHASHHHRIDRFFRDCQAGTLPAVSFVEPGIGVLSSLASALDALPFFIRDALKLLGAKDPGQTEEDPQDMYYGEAWAHGVVEAVLRSPSWPRTLLIYTYDEHGGYYDHVPPPAAIPPDQIAPKLSPGDPPGGYDVYGPRVPAVVVSPYSIPHGATDVLHDHTSVLATIEAKWNLPALTNRDANAATVMDFLNPADAALLDPPVLQGPSATGPSGPVTPPA